jgi:hypothetical protein
MDKPVSIAVVVAGVIGMIMVIMFLPATYKDEKDILSSNIYLSSTKVKDVNETIVSSDDNNDGEINPSSGGKSTAEGIDPSIEWGEKSTIPEQYSSILSTFTYYVGGTATVKGNFYYRWRNGSGTYQSKLAKQEEVICEGGYCYFEYNGYRYYTVALSAQDVTPDSQRSTINSDAAANKALLSGIGTLFKVNCEDGTEFGVIMVDAKAAEHTKNRNYWGQTSGSQTCALEFYIDCTHATKQQLQGNMAVSDPTNPRYNKKIESFQKGPNILK